MELTDPGHHVKVAGETRSSEDVADGSWRVKNGSGTKSKARKDREKTLTQELVKAKSVRWRRAAAVRSRARERAAS